MLATKDSRAMLARLEQASAMITPIDHRREAFRYHKLFRVFLLQHLRLARPFGLGDWGETAARWARWAEGWNSRELGQALRLARDADRALKSTTVTDEAGIVTQLVLQLGVLRREAA